MPHNVRRDRAFESAKKMPALRHRRGSAEFDVRDSDVIQWLARQPSVMQFVFDSAKESGAIVYNDETGKWHGADVA